MQDDLRCVSCCVPTYCHDHVPAGVDLNTQKPPEDITSEDAQRAQQLREDVATIFRHGACCVVLASSVAAADCWERQHVGCKWLSFADSSTLTVARAHDWSHICIGVPGLRPHCVDSQWGTHERKLQDPHCCHRSLVSMLSESAVCLQGLWRPPIEVLLAHRRPALAQCVPAAVHQWTCFMYC